MVLLLVGNAPSASLTGYKLVISDLIIGEYISEDRIKRRRGSKHSITPSYFIKSDPEIWKHSDQR